MRLLQAFIQGVCRPSRPLVILFLVDYQWVDNTSSGAIVAAREPHNTCVCEFFICGDQSHPEGSALLFQPNLLLARANTYPELKNSPRPSAALGLVVLRRPNNPAPLERDHERLPETCVLSIALYLEMPQRMSIYSAEVWIMGMGPAGHYTTN